MAEQNKAEVKFGGDASEIKRASQEAADSVKRATSSIRSDIGAASSGTKDSASQIARAVSGMGSTIVTSLVGVAAGFFGLQTAISSIKSVIKVAAEFEQLEIQLRAVMGSAAAGDRAFAWIKQFAVDTPYTVQSTTKAFLMLKNFGLDPMDGTLKKVADSAAKYGRGADAMERTTLALGQAWAKMRLQGQEVLQLVEAGIPVYELLQKATGKNAAELQKMGEKGQLTRDVIRKLIDEMGKAGAGTAEAKMNSMVGAWSNLGDSIANAVDDSRKSGGFAWITNSLKILTELVPLAGQVITESCGVIADIFRNLWTVISRVAVEIAMVIDSVFGTSSSSMTAMEFFKNILRVIGVAIVAFGTGLNEVFVAAKTSVATLSNALVTFGEVAWKALKLDFSGAMAAWDKGFERGKKIAAEGTAAMIDIAQKGRDRMNEIALGANSGGGKVANNPQRALTGSDMFKSGDDKSRMGQWEAQLADMKVAYQKANNLREMDKQDELAYWQGIMSTKKLNAQEQLAMRRKLAQTELEFLKKQRQEEKGLEEERISQMKRLGEQNIEATREQLRVKKSLGIISEEEELRGMLDIENRKYQIQQQALQDKLSLYEQDKVARQKVLDEIDILERQHAQNRQKIGNDILIEQKKEVDKWLGPVTSAVQQSVNGMIQGTLTWKKAVSHIGQSVVAEYISMGVKMLTNWISTQVAKMAFTKATAVQEQAVQTGTAAKQLATQKVLGVAGVTSNASIAATAAMGSVAAIPFYGWAMAPGVGAQTFATAMAFLPSAEGGWDIPSGTTGLMKFHEKEMMLPAKHADVIRDLADNGASAGGGMTFNVKAVDSRGIKRFMERNGPALGSALKKQARKFVK